jgi:hypothetical protein
MSPSSDFPSNIEIPARISRTYFDSSPSFVKDLSLTSSADGLTGWRAPKRGPLYDAKRGADRLLRRERRAICGRRRRKRGPAARAPGLAQLHQLAKAPDLVRDPERHRGHEGIAPAARVGVSSPAPEDAHRRGARIAHAARRGRPFHVFS